MSLKYRKYLGNNGKNWIWLTSKYIANNKQQVKLKVNIQVPLRDTKIFCQIISKRGKNSLRFIISGNQNSSTGIKTHMLKWPHPKRLKTAGYLSILYKTQHNLPVSIVSAQ